MPKYQKLQFFEWPLEAGSKSESIPIHLHVKMSIFTAEINMFRAWYMITVLGVIFSVTNNYHLFQGTIYPKSKINIFPLTFSTIYQSR